MDQMGPESRRIEELVTALREAGARFAYLFGSRADGTARGDSDIDLAAWFGRKGVDPLSVRCVDFDNVDLIVLDSCPLDLAGRVAFRGKLLFDDDPSKRVEWEATTRKVYADEKPRMEQAWRDFREGARRRAGRS